MDILVAPAGAGKTFTITKYAEAHEAATGGKVTGLATSTNAAEVMRLEGLREAFTIADWLGKVKDSRETRGNLPVGERDVLVVDESSMLSTDDLFQVQRAAARAGAKVLLTGDTEQLTSPEAGGALRMLAGRHGYWQLPEVFRFEQPWEREASLRLREGDEAAFAEYNDRGRIWDGTEAEMHEAAVHHFLADFLGGRDALLMTSGNAEADALSREVRNRLIGYGRVAARGDVILGRDGNEASVGDRIMARENWPIDAGGTAAA